MSEELTNELLNDFFHGRIVSCDACGKEFVAGDVVIRVREGTKPDRTMHKQCQENKDQ